MEKQQLQIKEKNITDAVANQIKDMQNNKRLMLPKSYVPENALKSAYLTLSDKGLLDTDKTALSKALLDMCVQGLNPSKQQCYFINYGGKVSLMRSYHGDRAVCLLSGLVKDINANIVYKGDKVEIGYDVEGRLIVKNHETSFENFNNEIVGAYAVAIMSDGSKKYEIMPIDRIKKSWSMSKNQQGNKLQTNFDTEACRRTVTRRLVKFIFNQSTDSNLVIDSYCETTHDEYIEPESIEDVNVKQVNETASVNPPEEVFEQKEETIPPASDSLDDDWASKF